MIAALLGWALLAPVVVNGIARWDMGLHLPVALSHAAKELNAKTLHVGFAREVFVLNAGDQIKTPPASYLIFTKAARNSLAPVHGGEDMLRANRDIESVPLRQRAVPDFGFGVGQEFHDAHRVLKPSNDGWRSAVIAKRIGDTEPSPSVGYRLVFDIQEFQNEKWRFDYAGTVYKIRSGAPQPSGEPREATSNNGENSGKENDPGLLVCLKNLGRLECVERDRIDTVTFFFLGLFVGLAYLAVIWNMGKKRDFRYDHRALEDGERTALAIKRSEGKRLRYQEPIAKA